jgi:phospholipid/cholesterol/gamma-HCH transport system ATP-binding protein
MIHVQEIHKSFGNAQVLKGVSFDVPQGKILALVGRSGCGKSVILKHIAGLLKPDNGHVFINGNDLCNLSGRKLLRLIERFGFLFQNGALFDSMTIFDNVAFPLREKTRLNEREIREKVLSDLDQVGLIGSEEKFPSQVSGGMIKRASLARALIEEPDIMLFDEPTTGLDPITGQSILALIDSCHKRFGFTGIIVTHEIPRVFSIVDKVALLHEGVVLFYGSPSEIMESNDPIIRPFIHAATNGQIKECTEPG